MVETKKQPELTALLDFMQKNVKSQVIIWLLDIKRLVNGFR
jgi:hypothetical protein